MEDADLSYQLLRLLAHLLAQTMLHTRKPVDPRYPYGWLRRTYTFKLRNELNDEQKNVIKSVLEKEECSRITIEWLRM